MWPDGLVLPDNSMEKCPLAPFMWFRAWRSAKPQNVEILLNRP